MAAQSRPSQPSAGQASPAPALREEQTSPLSGPSHQHVKPGPSRLFLEPASLPGVEPQDLRGGFDEPWYPPEGPPAGPCPKTFTTRKDAPDPVLVSILFPIPYPLFPSLCYNRPAVERAAKSELVQAQAHPAQAAPQFAAPLRGGQSPVARSEDPSRYCPVCSQRLESRRCKLICSVCGYYMSCADYY